jgi:hypothetical protein
VIENLDDSFYLISMHVYICVVHSVWDCTTGSGYIYASDFTSGISRASSVFTLLFQIHLNIPHRSYENTHLFVIVTFSCAEGHIISVCKRGNSEHGITD